MVYNQALSRDETSLEWALYVLKMKGHTIQGEIESIRIMPWSKVTRLNTTNGFVFLKEMAPPFSREPILIETLHQWHNEHLPNIIATNHALHSFLMMDSGIPLRVYAKGVFQLQYMCDALNIYAIIQTTSISHIEELFAIGVPDWRIQNLPNLFSQLMDRDEILMNDGLKTLEIQSIRNMTDRIYELCQLLSAYNIPSTIETMDFQDNNILIKDNNLTIADWGDAVISHPFFSLASCLHSAKRHYGIQETDESYHRLQDTYLQHWNTHESKERLVKAFQLAHQLRLIQVALSFGRVLKELNLCSLDKFKGYMANALRDFWKLQNDEAAKV
jgi:hypothetical protein